MKHHNKKDGYVLIPKSNQMFYGECDIDDKGYPITYEVELWKFANFMRSSADVTFHKFNSKAKAQAFVQEQLEQLLVCEVKVDRIRHTGVEGHPLDYKRIYRYCYEE